MLQNDMGNTLIQDSKTGHIMGLSEGFVPVGLKEHGGIMYIASVNKDGVGEIGTIPSPVLTLSLRAVDMDAVDDTLVNELGPVSIGAFISEKKIYPGEKFLPILNLQREEVNTEFFIYSAAGYQDFLKDKDLISHSGPNAYKGLYKMQLYSVYNSTNTELTHIYDKPLDVIPTQDAKDTWTGTPYWFIDGNWADIDIQQNYLNKGFLSYPGNIPPGKLLIKAGLEEIDFFQPIRSKQTAAGSKQKAPTLAPYVEKTQDDTTKKVTYILHFPGFEYQTGSIRFIKSLDISVRNAQTGEMLPLNSTSATSPLETFNTVEVISGLYQIQTGQNLITVDDNTGWTPAISDSLFTVSIGENLNQWYELVVKHYDWCGGEIGVYKYTFNPYHVLYLEDNYYNDGWVSDANINHVVDGPQKQITLDTTQVQFVYSKDFGLRPLTIMVSPNTVEPFENTNAYCVSDVLSYSGGSNDGLQFKVDFRGIPDYSYLWSLVNTTVDMTLPKFTVYVDMPNIDDKELPKDYLYQTYQLGPIPDTEQSVTVNLKTPGMGDARVGFSRVYDSGTANIGISLIADRTPVSVPIQMSGTPSIEYTLPFWYVVNDTKATFIFEHDEYQSSNVYNQITVLPTGTFSCSEDSPIQGVQKHEFDDPNYTITPSFSRFGYDDKNVLTPLGYNRQGLQAKAWTWGKNLLETTLSRDGVDPENTFDPDGRYYPTDFDEKQIILSRPGWYLLNIDTAQQTGAASINIKIQNNVYLPWTLEQGYFLPQLLYIPEDHTMLTISWSNVERLQGLGLYEVSRELLFIEESELNSLYKPTLIYYQHDDFIQGREPILQAAAAYHEDVMCLGTHYDYYAGMPTLTMTNLKKIGDEIISFIYKYNPEDKLYTLIGDDINPTKFRTDKTQQ